MKLFKIISLDFFPQLPESVKTGKSLRAIETLKRDMRLEEKMKFCVKTGKSLRAIETFFTFTSTFASTNVKN